MVNILPDGKLPEGRDLMCLIFHVRSALHILVNGGTNYGSLLALAFHDANYKVTSTTNNLRYTKVLPDGTLGEFTHLIFYV